MLRRLSIVAVVAVCAACGGGGDSGTTNPPVPVLASVSVSITPVSVQVGQSAVAAASGVDQNGTAIATGSVSWSSSATNVATIASTGAITAIAAGTTTIAASAGGKIGQAQLTVTLPPPVLTTLQIGASSTSITLGTQVALTLTARDQYGAGIASGPINWSSSNTSVATVSSGGIVTTFGPGTVTITASNGTVSAQIALAVLTNWIPTSTSTLVATSLYSNSRVTNRFGTSDYLTLDIICGRADKLFVLAVGFPHVVSRNGLIAYNATNIPSTSATWIEGSNFHSLIHPGPNTATKALANQIATGTDFVVAFGEFNGSTLATTFKVTGMAQAMTPVYAACPGASVATPAQAIEMIGELRAVRASTAHGR